MNCYTVYRHTSPSGKVYVGITAKNPKRRWHGGAAYKNNRHFYSAIQKYGWDNFEHEILEEGLSYEDACRLEIELIHKHQSTNPEKGYNRSPGGDKTTLGYKFSDEAREHISQALKGKRKGIRHTPEHCRRISEALKGHTVSDEVREKARLAMGDRFKTESALRKQKENTPRGAKHHRARKIRCVDTGEMFPTIQAAADAKQIGRTVISGACRGIYYTAGGLRWEYITEGLQ
jgi:group I intron endonuclease